MPDQHPTSSRKRRPPPGAGVIPAVATPPPHVSRIATRDADQHHAWINARFHDHQRRLRPQTDGFEYLSEVCARGSLVFARTRYRGAVVDTSWPDLPYIGVGHLVGGRHLIRWTGGEVRLAAGATALFPQSGFDHLNDCADSNGIFLPVAALQRVAEETTGLDPAQLRIESLLPISRTTARHWLRTAAYIEHGLYSRSLDHPLLLPAAEQMIAAVVLNTFPNSTMTDDVRTPRDPASVAIVRRAMAFIDAHADQPITLTDIAAEIGVPPRTLRNAFRHHRATTPQAYLQGARLARAREELLEADPGDGTTVAAVAARWGYARADRFAAAYRRMHGQFPSETLRS